MACKAAEGKALTTSKPTLEDKENWDEELPLPPQETPPGVRPMQPYKEDEWMVDQDPRLGSVAGDSRHGMMAVTPEAKPVDSNEELVGAMGEIDENLSVENLSDVEWKEDDPLFEFNDENVTIPQSPAAASTPVYTENETVSSLELPLRKKPCSWELIAVCLSKAAPPSHLEPDYSNAELVGYTQPPLVNVIPWIKYKAQNMVEPTFRQELQCIREVDHLQYIITMIVWFHRWRQEQGLWSSLPACGFQVEALATATIKTRVMSVTSEIEMTLGERQVLQVLTTLQYLAEVSPKSPPQDMLPTACNLLCSLCSRQRSHLCLTLYWDMPLQLDQEAPQLKWTYHVLIYPRYHLALVLLGTCLDLILDFDSAITNQPWEE